MQDSQIRSLLGVATEYCMKWQNEKYLPYNDLEIEYQYGVIRAIVDYYTHNETKIFKNHITKLGYNITIKQITGVDFKMSYKKIKYEDLEKLFKEGNYKGSFEEWMKDNGFRSEDGNREVSHHFSKESLNLGFRHYNMRVMPHKFADETRGIYIGGAYMEFDRVHREVDVTFSTDTIRAIANKLLELADQVDNDNVTMKEYCVGC